MAMQPIICASSSSSSSKRYDVFISFHGKDTRTKFTSHLHNALNNKVVAYIDEIKLQKGDEISSALIKAIEEAYASLVIFSQDYASSKWCLNELVKILECKKDRGHIVIPVFYEVDPSHVRKQNGSYRKAFEKHERDLKHDKDKLQKWRNALTEAGKLSGWHFKNDRLESNFIKDIVEDVLKQLNHAHPFEVNDEKLVGIEKKNQEVESLMKIGSNDVKTLGLWGMGGIGKTTLAKYVYAKMSSQFERRCFIENVREESTRCGLRVIRNKLFSTLLELRLDAPYVESPIFIRKLACEKSLIVLDDVATIEQAENLNIANNNYLGPGSRVIVTTRDKQICAQFDECKTYEVKGLKEAESLKLFCWSAFREKHPKKGYEELSNIATGYCRGNPLAIKVLGANFRKKSKEVWESELEKLKNIPNRGIYDVLKLSFDDLDRTQQDIFLDHACFFSFIGRSERDYMSWQSVKQTIRFNDRNYLTNLFNAFNFFAICELKVLFDKALISFKYNNRTNINEMEMHHLLEEMGREIVRKESPKDPGRRSRLWDSKEVYDVLKYNKGTEFIEAIYFNMHQIGDVYLNSDSFKSMINLRCLHINTYFDKSEFWDVCSSSDSFKSYNMVHFLEGLEWLPDKLRYIYWYSFPLESLPSTFCAERLEQLTMRCSKLKKLWDGIQKLDNLMIISLDYSEDLIEIPDLSLAPKLEEVSLRHCESLFQLHPSIFTAPKLKRLYLDGCKKIESLKTNIHLKSLKNLDLSDCSSLVEFSVTSEEMTELLLCGTAIHEFPSSMWRNSKLIALKLYACKNLNIVGKKLSNDPGLGSLTYLDLSGCTQINTMNLWSILDGLKSLKVLYLEKCDNLEAIPDNIENSSMLQRLDLDECKKLKSLPKLPSSLQNFRAINCPYLDTNSTRPMLENMLHKLQINNEDELKEDKFFLLPGSQVPYEFDYRATGASIVIPPIPISDLSCFIFCFILSEGLHLEDGVTYFRCTIVENEKVFHRIDLPNFGSMTLISDHVLLLSVSYGNFKSLVEGSKSTDDHYNLSFYFHYKGCDERTIETKGIKGCAVIPVYGLEHRNSSSVKIVELQSNAQVSDESDQYSELDINDLRHRSSTDEIESSSQVSDESDQHSEMDINDLQHRRSTDENEDDQQQQVIPPKEKEEELNDKSSCACSIGLLLKHLLEESKRYFS